MSNAQERRAAFRMDVVSRAICQITAGDISISGPIKDISIAGLYLLTEAQPPLGIGVDVEIVLSGRHSQMVIGSMTGKVVRTDEEGIAITFDQRFEWFAMVPLYFHTTSNHSS